MASWQRSIRLPSNTALNFHEWLYSLADWLAARKIAACTSTGRKFPLVFLLGEHLEGATTILGKPRCYGATRGRAVPFFDPNSNFPL